MNGQTQQLTSKILALKEPTELEISRLVQSAFDELLAPHDAKHAEHIALVNSTQDQARKDVSEIQSTLTQLQMEHLTAKDRIAALESELARLKKPAPTVA